MKVKKNKVAIGDLSKDPQLSREEQKKTTGGLHVIKRMTGRIMDWLGGGTGGGGTGGSGSGGVRG